MTAAAHVTRAGHAGPRSRDHAVAGLPGKARKWGFAAVCPGGLCGAARPGRPAPPACPVVPGPASKCTQRAPGASAAEKVRAAHPRDAGSRAKDTHARTRFPQLGSRSLSRGS